jgi:hypothetical protein
VINGEVRFGLHYGLKSDIAPSPKSAMQKYGSLFLSRPFRCLFDRILRLPLGSETMTVSAGAFSQHSQVFYGFSPTQLEDVVGDCGRTMHRLEDRYCAPA